jgi:hypothetical protein
VVTVVNAPIMIIAVVVPTTIIMVVVMARWVFEA